MFYLFVQMLAIYLRVFWAFVGSQESRAAYFLLLPWSFHYLFLNYTSILLKDKAPLFCFKDRTQEFFIENVM